jgi:alpha-ketoglutarate-dependent taurine dioxygenase
MRHLNPTVKTISYSRTSRVGDDVSDALQENKIVLLTGYDGNQTDLLPFYERLSDSVGQWVPMNDDLVTQEVTGRWNEIRYDPQIQNAYRHSSNRQPMHTDGAYENNAPDVVFFFCLHMDVVGGATTFVDSQDLLKYLERHSPQLLEDCQRIPVTFGKGSRAPKIRTIISWQQGDPRLTWNYYPVQETSPEVADLRKRFHDFLEHKVVEGGLCMPVKLAPGDALFFHDEQMLHGRNSFIAKKAGDRFLLKGGVRLTLKS